MKSEWKKYCLGDIIKFKNGKKRPSTNGKIPVYGGNGVLGYTDTFNNGNCIIIGRVGAYCGSVFIEKNNCWISDNAICGIATTKSDINFDYYLLKSLNLNKRHIGTSQPLLTQEILNKIEIKLPSLEEQKKIVSILSALDDKIEVNQKINENLEQQAQAIFKSWFVDFEPFKDGEFVNSELGQIPKGWNYKQVGELCKSISIKHKFNKDKLIFLNTGDIGDGKFINCNLMSVSDMPGQAKKSICEGDILYSEIRPINKHFAYVNFKANDYVVSTKLMVIRAEKIDSRRLYHYLTSKNIIKELQMEAESRSGTFPQIKFDNISRLPILIADSETETKFIKILHSFYKKIDYNNVEIEKLTKIRDALLPKLMNGEIDINGK